MLIYEIVEGEEGDVFKAIEDDALLEKVFDEFMKEVDALDESEEDGEEK